jgi:hypothetical protein
VELFIENKLFVVNECFSGKNAKGRNIKYHYNQELRFYRHGNKKKVKKIIF